MPFLFMLKAISKLGIEEDLRTSLKWYKTSYIYNKHHSQWWNVESFPLWNWKWNKNVCYHYNWDNSQDSCPDSQPPETVSWVNKCYCFKPLIFRVVMVNLILKLTDRSKFSEPQARWVQRKPHLITSKPKIRENWHVTYGMATRDDDWLLNKISGGQMQSM